VKAGWSTAELADVCVFENGDRGENYPSRSVQTTQGIPFINAGHLTDTGVAMENMNFIPRERFDLLSNGKIQRGDILFCLRGSLGKFASVGDLSEGAIASSLVIVRPRAALVPEFLLAYFASNLCRRMIEKYRNGAAQPNLSVQSLKKFTIPVPPLPEQRRIVAILEEAFAGLEAMRANAEKNLQNARELFDSYLEETFSQGGTRWDKRPFGDISENLDSRRKPVTKKDRVEGSIPYYGASGIVDYVTEPIFFLVILLVSEDGANLFARTYPIAFSVSGKCWVNNHAHVVRFGKRTTQRFVEYYLNSIPLDPYVSGMAQPKLNQKALNSIPIPIPPMDEQELIVSKADALAEKTEQLEAVYRQKLTAVDELKQSMLQKAFSGELTSSEAVAA